MKKSDLVGWRDKGGGHLGPVGVWWKFEQEYNGLVDWSSIRSLGRKLEERFR